MSSDSVDKKSDEDLNIEFDYKAAHSIDELFRKGVPEKCLSDSERGGLNVAGLPVNTDAKLLGRVKVRGADKCH